MQRSVVFGIQYREVSVQFPPQAKSLFSRLMTDDSNAANSTGLVTASNKRRAVETNLQIAKWRQNACNSRAVNYSC